MFGWCAAESDAAARVFGFAALYQAWLACRRGKRNTIKAQRYALYALDRLVDTSRALQAGAWRPSRASCFVVRYPKAREILAAQFADRVVHHVLVPWLEQRYEPVFIYDSFANRKGKGTHAAVRRLQTFCRRPGTTCFMQLDIGNFFNSINRRTLFGLLQTRVNKDTHRPGHDRRRCDAGEARAMLWLARVLLTGNPAQTAVFNGHPDDLQRVPVHKQLRHAAAETGLPIGNLTSQFFANVYLNELDQFIKHQLKVRYYVRYVDDFVLLHDSPQQLQQWRSAIVRFLSDKLALCLRDEGILAPVSQGMDFLGYILRPDYLLVRQRVVSHLYDKLVALRKQWLHADGSLHCSPEDAEHLHAMLASYWGHFVHAQSRNIRQAVLRNHPWLAYWLREDTTREVLKRCDRPGHEVTLPQQWHWFARRYPGYALMMQVGYEWECSHGPMRARMHQRPGLPPTYCLRAQQVPALQRQLTRAGQAWLTISEYGYQHNRRKQRQLTAAWPQQPVLADSSPFSSTALLQESFS